MGHVLQGRFKSIVVDKDSYLLELARYVVLNPVRANALAPKRSVISPQCVSIGRFSPRWRPRDDTYGSNQVLDHVSLGVTDLGRSRRFYDAVLRPLGIVRTVDFDQGRGSDYGTMAGALGVEFTITVEPKVAPTPGMHLCFRAPDRAAVRAFHAAGLSAGGRDDGPPGLRPLYHADYFSAFILDPDGHRIEAVCHAPELPSTAMTSTGIVY